MKKSIISFLAMSLLGVFFLVSCGNDPSSERAKDEMEEAADAVGDAIVDEKNDLKREIEAATADIDARLEKLNNDLKDAKEENKADIQKQIDDLEAKRKQLASDLEQFGNKADSEWHQFKANVKETIKDIGKDNKM